MRKTRKAVAVLTAVAMAAVSAVPAMADEIKDLYDYELQSREIETWNVLYSQLATDLQVLTNLYDGLLESDEYGKLVPAVAESWETEDNGITWTFHLRQGVKWVDQNGNEKGEVTAQDFLTGLEWVLNFHKNDATNTAMPMEMIVGAEDYYIKKEPKVVRSLFGLTGQYASVDEDISARENLMIFSRLNGLSRREAKERTEELLNEFSLVASADKAISNFSGGMRRRLDLAVSLISRPALIFLDEPTTGLDPRTRTQMWDTIRELVAEGSTIVLTTQYLEEADELADRIALIDHGKLVSLGTPAELKAQVGGAKLRLEMTDAQQADQAKQIVTDALHEEVKVANNTVTAPLRDTNQVAGILSQLTVAGLTMTNMAVEQPSMDDVFFALTVGKN